MQNGFVKNLNGICKYELLGVHLFSDIFISKKIINNSRRGYNLSLQSVDDVNAHYINQ